MNIISTLMWMLSDDQVATIATQTGLSPDQTKSAVTNLLPLIMDGIGNNVTDPMKAKGLYDALDQHTTADPSSVNLDDGQKILWHVFGDNLSDVQASAAKSSGIETSQIANLMSYLAPLAMGLLGQQKAQGGLDLGGLMGLLGGSGNGTTGASAVDTIAASVTGLLGGNTTTNATSTVGSMAQSVATNLLDTNRDGKVSDDLLRKGIHWITSWFTKK